MEWPANVKLVKLEKDGIQVLEDQVHNAQSLIKKDYPFKRKEISDLGARFLQFQRLGPVARDHSFFENTLLSSAHTHNLSSVRTSHEDINSPSPPADANFAEFCFSPPFRPSTDAGEGDDRPTSTFEINLPSPVSSLSGFQSQMLKSPDTSSSMLSLSTIAAPEKSPQKIPVDFRAETALDLSIKSTRFPVTTANAVPEKNTCLNKDGGSVDIDTRTVLSLDEQRNEFNKDSQRKDTITQDKSIGPVTESNTLKGRSARIKFAFKPSTFKTPNEDLSSQDPFSSQESDIVSNRNRSILPRALLKPPTFHATNKDISSQDIFSSQVCARESGSKAHLDLSTFSAPKENLIAPDLFTSQEPTTFKSQSAQSKRFLKQSTLENANEDHRSKGPFSSQLSVKESSAFKSQSSQSTVSSNVSTFNVPNENLISSTRFTSQKNIENLNSLEDPFSQSKEFLKPSTLNDANEHRFSNQFSVKESSAIKSQPTGSKGSLTQATFQTPTIKSKASSVSKSSYMSEFMNSQSRKYESAWGGGSATKIFSSDINSQMRTPSKPDSGRWTSRPGSRTTSQSQDFRCLSISSILDEIGFEKSQMQNILPPSATWKRKLVMEDDTKNDDGSKEDQDNDLSDFQYTQENNKKKRKLASRDCLQHQESSPDFEEPLLATSFSSNQVMCQPDFEDLSNQKFITSSPKTLDLTKMAESPHLLGEPRATSSNHEESSAEEDGDRLNDTIDEYISKRIDSLMEEPAQEKKIPRMEKKTESSISKKISKKMKGRKADLQTTLTTQNIQTQISSNNSSKDQCEQIRSIDCLSEEEIDEVVESEELCFCFTFQGNYTSFHNISHIGKDTKIVRSMVVRAAIKSGSVLLVHVPLNNHQIILKFVNAGRPRKLVFGAKNFLKTLVDSVSGFSLQSELSVMDLQIGCLLVMPEKSPNSFQECLNLLNPELKRMSTGTKQDLAQDLNDLSLAGRQLMDKLETDALKTIFFETEMIILPLVVAMELNGVQVDTTELERIGQLLEKEARRVETECIALAGVNFNLASAKQVREVLYDKLKLDQEAGVKISTTAGGVKSTCEASLKKITHNKIPGLILKYRQLMKSQSAYITGLLKHCSGQRGIHCTWDQLGAVTGRITSDSPNLQAIPKSDIELENCSVNIRRGFIPRIGYTLVAADYEQIELRILAHLSGDPNLIRAIKTGGDIFIELTAVWLEKPVNSVQKSERDKTKQVVYALMYGAGKQKLSEILEVGVDQAHTIITSFYAKFSQIKSFQRGVVQRAHSQGYLVTMFGRKRSFPHINSNNIAIRIQAQRQAFNFLIQGTAADIMKKGLLQGQKSLSNAKLDAQPLLLVHDEIVWEVKSSQLKACIDNISASLQQQNTIFPEGVQFKLDLSLKVSFGSNLADLERWIF